jgi:hypothetical protein
VWRWSKGLSLLWSYDFDVDDRVLTTAYAGPAARNGLLVRPGLTFVHPAG